MARSVLPSGAVICRPRIHSSGEWRVTPLPTSYGSSNETSGEGQSGEMNAKRRRADAISSAIALVKPSSSAGALPLPDRVSQRRLHHLARHLVPAYLDDCADQAL